MYRTFLLAILPLTGCVEMAMNTSDLGVTPGGSQDIGYAREIIAEGRIPTDGMFTAEGLFSEHDLPLTETTPCDEILCPRTAAGLIDPVDGSGEQILVQLGFGTRFSAETFERRPLNLALAVDVSGSMAGTKLPAVQQALRVLVDQLGEQDRMALVTFSTRADIRLPLTTMDESGREDALRIIDSLDPEDSTCIECGLGLAFGEVAPEAGVPGIEDRVMLFTDAQPNVQATDVESFLGMTRYYAAAGIGISLFGVGIDMGNALADEISQTPGGNYFYLADEAAIRAVFDEEFDYLVSPVAYDLEVEVGAADGFALGEAFGAPIDEANKSVEFGASTLFLSSKNGGIGFTLTADGITLPDGEATDLGTFHLSYVPVDVDEPVVQDMKVSWQGGSLIAGQETLADDLGVYKMGGLVDEYLSLVAGNRFCDGRLTEQEARAEILEARDGLDAMARQLTDAPLAAEVLLLEQLAENLSQGQAVCAW